MNLSVIIPLVLYIALIIGIALYSLKKEKRTSLSNYFIGERSLNGFLLAMTLVATYVSASSFIGGPGAAYQFGLGWVLLALIQVPAVLLSLGILGKKFALLARQYQAVTLNDILYARYRSRIITYIASISLILAFSGAMTVQLAGAAKLLHTALDLPYHISLIGFSLITILYTSIGGFRAGVLNDAMQGVVMLLGATILLIVTIYTAGGLSHAIATLQHINPELTTPYGAGHILTLPFMFSFWILVCFGTVGLPHTAVRCFAYRDSHAVHRAIIMGTIVITLLMFTLHLTGALGRALVPNLKSPDDIIPTLMVEILPPLLSGIFLAAPLAAIMSTINAQLLQTSSALLKDLYLGEQPKQIKSTRLRYLTIGTTFTIGMIVMLMAWSPPKMIVWLNLFAFGGLEAVFLWPLIFGLYHAKTNANGVIFSMLTGGISYLIFAFFNINWFGLNSIIPTLLLSLFALLLGNKLSIVQQK